MAVSNGFGQAQATIFDALDRATNSTDGNGVSVATTFDDLDRVRTRTYPDSGIESLGYTFGVAAFTSQTNELGSNVLNVTYDPLNRKITEVFPGISTNSFGYTPAGDLSTLTDGRGLVTTWHTDEYGRTTNKVDQTSTEILRYQFDPNRRLTNRWSSAVGNTAYSWDAVGNLTNISYPHDSAVRLAWDMLNRLTNMVDGIGTNKFTYSPSGQLLTEDGPWASDTVTNTYANRLRTALSLQQPTGSWTNGFGYDGIKRLTNVSFSGGAISYQFSDDRQSLISRIGLPNTSYRTNTFDSVARLLSTALKNNSGTVLDSSAYLYNPASQRTNLTRYDSSVVAFVYDNASQLIVADSSVSAEDRGYSYDAGWNLRRLTNNGVTTRFTVNDLNELTNSPFGSATFDSNGNTLTSHSGSRQYQWDDENRLISLLVTNNVSSSTFTDFYYDGLSRLRKRLEYIWLGSASGTNPPDEELVSGGFGPSLPSMDTNWVLTSTTVYIYDGNRVIQERDGSNNPVVSYTRGTDLSGSLEGAGGIGGLLARSSGYSGGNFSTHVYYHSDGGGNVTALEDASQNVVARYRYDPFGNVVSSSGSAANDNVYRFSTKEVHAASGLNGFLFRFQDPAQQRWLSRDPAQESDGINLYSTVINDPVNQVDPLGLMRESEIQALRKKLDEEVSKTPCCCDGSARVTFDITGTSSGATVTGLAKPDFRVGQGCIINIYSYFWWTCYQAVKEGGNNTRAQGWTPGGSSYSYTKKPGIDWWYDRYDRNNIAMDADVLIIVCIGGRQHALLVTAANELNWAWDRDKEAWTGPAQIRGGKH